MTEPATARLRAVKPGAPESLAAALAEFQANLPPISKDAAAIMPGKDGKKPWGYKYADLADVSHVVLPAIGKLGLSFTARPTLSDGKLILAYSLKHVSGEHEDGEWPLGGGTPQQLGSAITYGRRYCLLAVTGAWPAELDDDGEAAGQAVAEQQAAARRQRNSPPETDRHGAATAAEQARMVRGPEPGVTRLASTPPDDEFYAPQGPPEDAAGSVLPEQKTRMFAMFSGAGMRDKESQLAFIEKETGDRLASRNDLSAKGAARVLQALEGLTDARAKAHPQGDGDA